MFQKELKEKNAFASLEMGGVVVQVVGTVGSQQAGSALACPLC